MTDFAPQPRQVLFLWSLLCEGGEAWLQGIRPRLTKTERDALQSANFIDVQGAPTAHGGHGLRIQISEEAWGWMGDHMDAALPRHTPATGAVLQAVLRRLQPVLQHHGIPLVEIFAPEDLGQQSSPDPVNSLNDRVAMTCLELGGGRANIRVRLADLHRALPEISQQVLNDAVLALQDAQRLTLYPLDDPSDITAEDRQAAILVAGYAHHILYLDAK